MAQTLLQAVQARWQSSGAEAGLGTTALYVGQAPEDSPLPLCVLVHRGQVPDWTFEAAYKEVGQVEFWVLGVGLAAVEALARQVMGAFDWVNENLPFSGGVCESVERTNYVVAAEDDRDDAGEQVYRAEVHYTITLVYAADG